MEYEFIDFEVPTSKVFYLGEPEKADYVSIQVGEFSFKRSTALITKTDHDTFTFRLPRYNARKEDFKVELCGRVTVPGKEESEVTEFIVTTTKLKELIDENMLKQKETQKFVIIKLSKKRFVGEPWKTENMKEARQSIFAPDGFKYNRPVSKIHEIKGDPHHVLIYLPEKAPDGNDYMIHLTKSERQEDGTYLEKTLDISAKDLGNMYAIEKKEFENQRTSESDFVEIIISKKQVVGEPWLGTDAVERRSILAPDGFTFSRKSSQLHEIKDDPDHLKISLPKTHANGSQYMVNLAKSVKAPDGNWATETKEVSSMELKESYEAAKQQFRRSRTR